MNHHIGEYDPAVAAVAIFQHPHKQHFHHATHPITSPTDRDVINGRGQGVHRHPGNANYRKLVVANKILYAKCPGTDKVKISKGIVDAVRKLGGSFLKLDKLTGLYHDIGDKKAKEKTSQALREGQTSIRKGLHRNGEMSNTSKQKQSSAADYFVFSVQVLELLWKADGDAPAMKYASPSPPFPPVIPAEAVTKPVLPTARRPAAVPPTSTINSVNCCSSDQVQFAGLMQTTRNEIGPATIKARSDRGTYPHMQRTCDQESFKAEDFKPSMMPSDQPRLSHAMPPLPPVARAISDDSCPSIHLTNMSHTSTSSGAHILESTHNSNVGNTSENIRGTIESATCDIDEVSRLSEQRITQVLSMNAEEMNETVKLLEDEQVALKDEEDASQHSNSEVVLSYENKIMMEHVSNLRFSDEDCAKPDHNPLFTGSMRFAESSQFTKSSMTLLMDASVMTFGMDDMTERTSHDGRTVAV